MSTTQPQGVGIRANQLVRTWRRWVGVCLALLVVACGEGYGTDDEALVLTYGMSQEKTLPGRNLAPFEPATLIYLPSIQFPQQETSTDIWEAAGASQLHVTLARGSWQERQVPRRNRLLH